MIKIFIQNKINLITFLIYNIKDIIINVLKILNDI